jgi:hypothetical protein
MTGVCFLASYIPQFSRSFFATFMVAFSNVLSRGQIRSFLFGPIRRPLFLPEGVGAAGQLQQRSIQSAEGVPNLLSPMTRLRKRRHSTCCTTSTNRWQGEFHSWTESETTRLSLNQSITNHIIFFNHWITAQANDISGNTTIRACPLIQGTTYSHSANYADKPEKFPPLQQTGHSKKEWASPS